MISCKRAILTLSLLALFGCNNSGSSHFPPVEDAPLPETYLHNTLLNIERSPERTVRGLQNHFNRLVVDEKVPVKKLQSIANLKMSDTRSKILADFMKLDEDGSGHLSMNETLSLSRKQQYNWYNPNSDFISTKGIDKNEDGQLSFYEIYDFARKTALIPNRLTRAAETELNVFNSDGDEFITRSEFEEGLEQLLNKDFRKTVIKSSTIGEKQASKQPPKECVVELPSKSARVIFLSGMYGAAVPNISLTGQGIETQAVKITIEEGVEPLYIVATAYRPIIWSISGATERVERFVASPSAQKNTEVVGVAGLKKSQVNLTGKGCLPHFSRPTDASGFVAKAKWAQLIKRQPDIMFGGETLRAVSLPEEGIAEDALKDWQPNDPKLTHEERLRYVFKKTRIDGILKLRKEDVISADPIEIYGVLPGDAGLIQLIDKGVLDMVDHKTFRITKPLKRLPAPVSRPSTNAFILGKGLPMPEELTGNIRIFAEESGDCLYGRNCNKK